MAAGGATPTAVQGNLIGPTNAGVNTTAATGAGQTGLIGSISDALGVQNQFQGQAANLTPGTNVGQLNTAYGGVQNTLNQQGQIANQLLPQVGSAVENQNFLANQYAQMAQGQGPNPAQTELNTATGQNVANQASLMAGQRGASANAGLIARQAAQQGAQTQQQAVGQAATLEAQQQIAAQQNLANLTNNQVAQAGNATSAANTGQQNEQNILQNANTSLNNAAVGMQSNLNNVNSQSAIANQNANAQTSSGLTKLASNIPVIGSLFGAKGGQVGTDFGMAEGGPIVGNPLAAAPAPVQDSWAAPVFSQGSASSGPVIPETPAAQQGSMVSPISSKKHVTDGTPENAGQGPTQAAAALLPYAAAALSSGGKIATGPHRSHVANFLAGGGATSVKAIVSPKEVYLNPEQVHKVVHEGADPMKIGHKFPGTDKVKGKDSKKNDIIPTTLEDGGCVIPVHITTHKQASERGRKFVARTMAKHMKRPAGAK